jgi:FkbM family methyltransferase
MPHSQVNKLEHLAKGSRLTRFLNNPLGYATAMGIKWLIYPLFKKGWLLKARTFWKEEFWVRLPAGNDIYIMGGKSDDSELRLTRFIMKQLKKGDSFIDVGSHYGFYARLALKCIGSEGRVWAIEPASDACFLLKKNLESYPNAAVLNLLAGAESGAATFYEFPLVYSEYNTIHIQQYEHAPFFQHAKANKKLLPVTTIDSLVSQYGIKPDLIKIDVEGAEYEVLKGAVSTLAFYPDLLIVIEYLCKQRGNEMHNRAVQLLRQYHFSAFTINQAGLLERCENIDSYLLNRKLESDNIVFKRLSDN